SKRYENIGDYHHALVTLDRALSWDALQEDLHRERIRILYFSGDRPGAIRHYDYLRRLLDEELGVPPMKETRDLYDDLVNDRLKMPTRPAPSLTPDSSHGKRIEIAGLLPFIGRRVEMEYLQDKIASGRLLLIEGEPGIGKTRLVQEFLKKT